MTAGAKVFIGVPSYDDRVCSGILNAHAYACKPGSENESAMVVESGSWLTRNFNSLYAGALNRLPEGFTHFCLLHDDIDIREAYWLDKMLGLMTKYEADVLSAIVPIKNGTGLTSTALDELVGEKGAEHVRRITLTEAYGKFPPTFTHEKILLNTGLMLVDIRKTWANMMFFEFEDRILQVPRPDGGVTYKAVGCPEDWNFSRRARGLGAKLFATTEVKVNHVGIGRYGNSGAWGSMKADQ